MTNFTVDHSPDDEPGLPSAAPFEVPDYSIAPEDQHIADEIVAMDPLRDVPGPATMKGDAKIVPDRFTLTTLPPGPLRDRVEQQLALQPPSKREEAEHELVKRALEANGLDLRGRVGVGSGATPYHKEQAQIASEIAQLDREYARLTEDMGAVREYVSRINEESGKAEAEPVPMYGAERQKAMLNRMLEIQHIVALKQPGGLEYERRMAKALRDSVAIRKAHAAQKAKLAKVEARATELIESEEIERLARSKARMMGAELKD